MGNMKIIEGIKEKGRPFRIPDASRNDLPEFFKEMGYKVGAEIGVYKGEFTKKFLDLGMKMYAIDPWMEYNGTGRAFHEQETIDVVYEEAKTRLSPYPDCTILRKTSMDALSDVPDESLDFVYIDGDHSYIHITEDLYWWAKKVRKGGVVSGHDYFRTASNAKNVLCHVKPVVDAHVVVFGVMNFYLVGKKGDDHYFSWLWINQSSTTPTIE
mgnify:CR=1 FL=1